MFLGVHHSTALRLLHVLRQHRFVHELPDHRYRLGANTFRLGFQALEAIDLRVVARPFMEKLNEVTGETVHLGALQDDEVVYIEKVEARHQIRMHSRIGGVATLHCAGVAKGVLAFLPDVRRLHLVESRELARRTANTLTTVQRLETDLVQTRARGYAIDDEENEPDIHCVAAPVFTGTGDVVGAMSVTAPTSRIDRETLLGFVPELLKATKATSEQLGWVLR
ncbi:IclR family transcriptional regulator [Planosporangium flavigriseum]|uniref:IclR family transcriptional regulator n=2 Tax=Planosporangium flavigriseum TaxID=373681 RepID=A0A8J3LZW7_9ACTN|nr:IclR family transcriptional regulator [Planosporangium flavigriseum]